jgi:hypothetical protein
VEGESRTAQVTHLTRRTGGAGFEPPEHIDHRALERGLGAGFRRRPVQRTKMMGQIR